MDHKTIEATLETLRLKEESRLMEERLAMLKNLMQAEKASRRAISSTFWSSGQKGPLKKQYTAEQPKNLPKTGKIRILTDSNDVGAKIVQLCDKCTKYRPSVTCLECAEDYCSACFIRLHQKGALVDHHASPIVQQVSLQTNVKKQWIRNRSNVPTCTAEDHVDSERKTELSDEGQGDTPVQRGSLLQGTYDEEASAVSFQEALQEWRAGRTSRDQYDQQVTTDADNSSASKVSTEVQSTPHHVSHNTIAFTAGGGVSYLEKLMIQSNRIDPLFLPNLTKRRPLGGQCQQEESLMDLGAESQGPSQYNIFYSTEDGLVPSDEVKVNELIGVQSCLPEIEHFPLESEMQTTLNITSATQVTTAATQVTTAATQVTTAATLVTTATNPVTTPTTPVTIPTNPVTTSTNPVITTTNIANSGKVISACEPQTTIKGLHKKSSPAKNRKGVRKVPQVHELMEQQGPNSANIQHNLNTPNQEGVTVSLCKAVEPEEQQGIKQAQNIDFRAEDQQDTGHEALSRFFLSEVGPHPSKPQQPQAAHHTPSLQAPSSHESNSCFRLGAVVWLPENSRLLINSGEAPTNIDLAMLLPPRTSPVDGKVQVLSEKDDSSHDSDEVCSVQDDLWDEREDLEAIESLAWELSSTADGRVTQSTIDEDCGHEKDPLSEDMNGSISTVSVDQVMEEFDHYQKSVMSQEC